MDRNTVAHIQVSGGWSRFSGTSTDLAAGPSRDVLGFGGRFVA